MKKIPMWWWIVGIIIFIVGLFGWSRLLQSSDPNTIAQNGLHWHPQLAIYVDGEQQEIPANIGLGGVHQPIHTHAEDAAQGVIHLEFEGVVRRGDLRLGKFFEIWGRDMRSGFGTLVRMTVNGEESTEYETYILQENDSIELFYESGASSVEENSASLGVPAPGIDPALVDEMIVDDGARAVEGE